MHDVMIVSSLLPQGKLGPCIILLSNLYLLVLSSLLPQTSIWHLVCRHTFQGLWTSQQNWVAWPYMMRSNSRLTCTGKVCTYRLSQSTPFGLYMQDPLLWLCRSSNQTYLSFCTTVGSFHCAFEGNECRSHGREHPSFYLRGTLRAV